MAEDIALSVGAKILEYLVEPVLIRPLRLIFCFKSSVDDFHQESEKLSLEKVRVEGAIRGAKDDGLQVYDHVDKWVEDVKRVMEDAQRLHNQLGDNKGCCFNATGWTCRYRLSKQVWETTNSIKEVCERVGSLNPVGAPLDLRQHIGLSFSEEFMASKSADLTCTAIIEALRKDDSNNKIGLYGPGGSGKTTLAIQVREEAQRLGICDRIIMVTVRPQTTDVMIRNIQSTVADFLNLRLEQESEAGRASRLHQRLRNEEKILIILDEGWKGLDLTRIGIPSSPCKVLLIAHELHVCNSLKTREDIGLDILSEDEAWALFKSVAGVGDPLRVQDVTKKIVRSCRGLPKALVTVGRTLRGKEHSQWEETLKQLENDLVQNIVDDLQKERGKLNLKKERVNNQIEMAKKNAQVIEKDVEKWLADVERAMEDLEQFQNELNQNIWCLGEWDDLISRKGVQLLNDIKKLCEDGTFDRVAHPAAISQDIGLSFSKDYFSSKSAHLAFNDVMVALKNDDVNMIGLYGMGGVGKTTLAKEVHKEADRLKIFDRVIMVTISQTLEVRRVQGVIADFLNLNLTQESEEGRASKLSQRLKTEKILIILDDVWKPIELEAIGISVCECKGSKVLLTTRLRHVCISMNSQTNIPLNLLSEDEAWYFFKKKADLPDSSKLNDVARQIVDECKGLPIALGTVGSALRHKRADQWIEALQKLKDARLVNILGVGEDEKNAYKCLQLSYDYLKQSADAQAQFLLLLCSLFPEDYEIHIEDLIRCSFGMELYERVRSIGDARRKVRMTVEFLKDSGLLLDAESSKRVKMHDLVRDAVLWIGGTESPERRVFTARDGSDLDDLIRNKRFQNCRAVSFMADIIHDLRNYELDCPELECILIFGGPADWGSDSEIKLGDAFFKHVEALKVLEVKGRGEFSVPESLKYLAKLRSLNLTDCTCCNSSVIGELRQLEILSFNYAAIDCAIEVASELKKLRMLDLRNYGRLQMLPSNFITNFSKLEELYTSRCSLSELNSLPNLVRFRTCIRDAGCLPLDFCFPDLEWYMISINESFKDKVMVDRGLLLQRIQGWSQLNVFRKLLPKVEHLTLSDVRFGRSFNSSIPWMDPQLGSFPDLTSLELLFIDEITCFVDTTVTPTNTIIPFPSLVRLRLLKMSCLRVMCHGPPPNGFLQNLKHLKVEYCNKLKHIWQGPDKFASSLHHLETLELENCDDLEEVFSGSARDYDGDDLSCFQNLKELLVRSCGKLRSIFPRSNLRFPKLESLVLIDNAQLQCLYGQPSEAKPERLDPDSFCSQFPSLRWLEVLSCPELSPHFLVNIQSLLQAPSAKQIWVIRLGTMLEVEETAEAQREYENDQLLTFNLAELNLYAASHLKCIWSGLSQNICFSNLKNVIVKDCNSLRHLFTVPIARSLKQLCTLQVESCNNLQQIITDDEIDGGNINHILVLPGLSNLYLIELPNLIRFGPPAYNLKLPKLFMKYRHPVQCCPKMKLDFLEGIYDAIEEIEVGGCASSS